MSKFIIGAGGVICPEDKKIVKVFAPIKDGRQLVVYDNGDMEHLKILS